MFLIFGTPRSGTTLLAQCLSAHPDIIVPRETDFIVPLAFLYTRILDERLGKSALTMLITQAKDTQRSLNGYLSPQRITEIIRDCEYQPDVILESLYKEIARMAGARIAGDKSPNDLDYAKILIESGTISSRVKILHIVRDVRDVMVSLNHTGWLPDPDLYFPRFWCNNNLYIRAKFQNNPSQYFFLRYEDMVREPEKTFSSICNFLDVDFQPDMLSPENRQETYRHDHPNIFKPIFTDKVGVYKNYLDRDTIARYEKQAVEAMEVFGYRLETENIWRKIGRWLR